jgi:hypothetical protein
MATTTPNYGWPVPTSTDLVKDGATAIEALGDAADATVFGLGVSGAWTAFTPTLTNITLGNGTLTARYKQIGKTVVAQVRLTFGTTTSITGAPTRVNLPVTAATANDFSFPMYILDSGAADYIGRAQLFNTAYLELYVNAVGGTYGAISAISSTVPMTWTTNDKFSINFVYEAA